jgi:putative ABC transport system substrate-binding protein
VIRRRDFTTLFGGAAAWPLAARAQPSDKIVRVGFFGADRSGPLAAASYQAFLDEMQIHGFNDGKMSSWIFDDWNRIYPPFPPT